MDKPAPTAEEQLPERIEFLYECSKRDDYIIVGSEIREIINQLRAALRSNREKDAQLDTFQQMDVSYLEEVIKVKDRQLAEKDAKIAELERKDVEYWKGHAEESHQTALALITENNEVRAKLRAVAEAAKEKLEVVTGWRLGALEYHSKAPVDSLLSRIGKLAE